MSKIHIKNGIILTFNEDAPVLYNHIIAINDGMITAIAPEPVKPDADAEVIDAAGKVVMPGLINAHHHFYSTLVRGLGKAAPSKDFNEVLENLWWRLDKKLVADDIYYSALISALDAVRHGTTILIDHHASPGCISGSLPLIADAVIKCGLKANLCYEVSDRDGDCRTLEGIRENMEWLHKVNRENHPQLKGLFGMHAAFTLSDKTLEMISMEGNSLQAGYHIHVAEAQSDEDYSLKHHQKRVVQRLDAFGLLNAKSIAAHCVHIDESEMDILAERNTAVVHNPQSNQNNAVGIADVVKLTQKGITVGLGTDAMTVNMLEEIRMGMWAQHLKNDPSQGFMEIANTLIRNNAVIANRYWDGQVGSLEKGKHAEIVLRDYQPPTPLNEQTWIGHLIYGISQSVVDTTIANGKILYRDKKFCIDIDEKEVAARSRECALKLWDRF